MDAGRWSHGVILECNDVWKKSEMSRDEVGAQTKSPDSLGATTRYADFGFLKQAAARDRARVAATRGKAANPLEELLTNAAVSTTRE
jgi:hypothetical protein